MSSYQFYEFLAVDRALDGPEIDALHGISSRAEISPTRFAVEYNYSDLRVPPAELLARYFDVFVYVSSWGTRALGLRWPTGTITPRAMDAYRVDEALTIQTQGSHTIATISSESDDCGWVEGEAWMADLAGVRREIFLGDHRALYLAWLAGVQHGDVDEAVLEPVVPVGLGALTAAQRALVTYLRLDKHLLAAAAEGSEAAQRKPTGLGAWISALSEVEKDALLLRAVEGAHAQVAVQIEQRFLADARPSALERSGRALGDLLDRAAELRVARLEVHARRAAEAQRKAEARSALERAVHLKQVATRQSQIWTELRLVAAKTNAKGYEAAVAHLVDLRDVAEREGTLGRFEQNVAQFASHQARKPALMRRLRAAGLIGAAVR